MSRRVHRNLLSRINPFLKIGLSFGLIGLSLFLKHIAAMVVLVGGVVLMMTQLKLRPLLLGYGLFMVAVFTGSTALLLGNGPEAIFSTLRLLAILLPTPVLALTTPPADLIRSLQTVRLPSFLTLSLMLIWRFFPLMQQELQRIWEANQLRGIDLRWRPRQWFSGLMVPLVFQMVVYADEVTIGLQTRGYSPTEPRSNSKPLRWQWADSLFCGVAIAHISLITYLEWGR
ncbi:MAG: energy-coupling factor transporter transmembrane component T family protein [Thermosynechococcaceae cyanobacterium]